MKRMIIDKAVFPVRMSIMMEETGQTTYSLAEALSLTPATISRYSNGLISPKVTAVYKMAEVFGVNPLWLMGYEKQPKNVEKEPLPPLEELEEAYISVLIEKGYLNKDKADLTEDDVKRLRKNIKAALED